MAERKGKGKARAVPAPPHGAARLAWVGPGFLWMVSAAGSGELLFTPRIGALFGYALVVGEPVTLLKLAGGVEAAHIPVVAAATVLLNRRLLPEPLRPGIVATSLTWTAALFFAGFAGFYVYDTFS